MLLSSGQVLDNVLVHVTDWYPTLLSAAGAEVGHHRSKKLYGKTTPDNRYKDTGVIKNIPIDGKDLWDVIAQGMVQDAVSWKKREILLDLDDMLNCTFSACGAIRKGDWKYIRGANMVRNEHSVGFTEWQRYFLWIFVTRK